jgi:hypothetical protein
MKKVFFVCDSYHTSNIAKAIEKAFPEAVIYMDTTVTSSDGGDAPLGMLMGLTKSMTEEVVKKDKIETKIDYFILSGKLILDGAIKPEELKAQHGSENAVTIGVSTMSFFLQKISGTVDQTVDKEVFKRSDRIKDYFEKEMA